MTQDDVLFGYRQQLFAEAARSNVTAACRTFGVHRSTYYAWKRQVERHGLEALRPRERRRPKMPSQLSTMVEERVVSFSIAHPGLGPKRVASELRREKWGAIVVSPNGVWKVLSRHGLNTRAKRFALVAGYAAPYEPPRDPGPEQHIDVDRRPKFASRSDQRRSSIRKASKALVLLRHRLLREACGFKGLRLGLEALQPDTETVPKRVEVNHGLVEFEAIATGVARVGGHHLAKAPRR